VARPMPRPAPVTIATLPSRRSDMSISTVRVQAVPAGQRLGTCDFNRLVCSYRTVC
jgi:hypothetical protein